MTKRNVIALLLAGGTLTGVYLFILSCSERSTYQGRSFDYWLQNGSSNDIELAVQHIGTNALPYMVELLQSEDSRVTEQLFQMAYEHLPFEIPFESAKGKQFRALTGFQVLGTNAYPAIPVLSNMLQEARSPICAAMALSATGSEAIPSLTNALSHTNYLVRFAAISALGIMTNQGEPTISLIAVRMKDAHRLVRFGAAEALGEIRAHSETTIPALTDGLNDPQMTVRWASAESLGKFGSQAKPAVPKLVEMLGDDPRFVRPKVAQALKAIDPEAAAKAGVK